jgi:hypothetical protein
MASNACRHREIISRFPKEIEDFANAFVAMQEKRHLADYDPHERFSKSEVLADIAVVRQAVSEFEKAVTKDRRAFCAYVLFKRR